MLKLNLVVILALAPLLATCSKSENQSPPKSDNLSPPLIEQPTSNARVDSEEKSSPKSHNQSPPVIVWSESNAVNDSVLAPKLLDDRVELAKYLSEFPKEKYEVFDVENVGKFYLDDNPALVKETLKSGRPWEPKVLENMTKYAEPGSTALDVGAHIGSHTLTLSKAVGEEGKVYAFEPQKKVYRELVKNLELNSIKNTHPLRFAIGDQHGIIEMTETKGRDGSMRVGTGGDKAELRTIDSFGFRNVSLLKIDVEGFELSVLKGAAQTIQKWHPAIVIEIVGYYQYESIHPDSKKRVDGVKRFFKENEYELSFIELAGQPHFIALHQDKHAKSNAEIKPEKGQ